ncbi:hypothetical protein PYW07_002224 [Mythimna separata]|uniref:Lipase domain-containing protein n=1 Tax=Mythimna separata TaxID=271217 RepID=A0AAD8DU57_MYTSE|nr:hypothetical protein PYW07_002224 [Mythimna separata]
MFGSAFIIFFTIGAVLCGDREEQAKLRLYYNAFENYTEVLLEDAQSHPTGPAVTAVIKAYLEQGQSNVALLNWDRLAASIHNSIPQSYLNWAIPNALKLGADFADVLLNLSASGLDLNKTHLVGHSLGAHIVGITGNRMVTKGVRLPWITGLDPAGIIFDGKMPFERLNPYSAGFVDVIHSDPNRYGSNRELGTVDFWPNYRNGRPVVQPGCDNKSHPRFSPEDLCNHHKCWQFLIDSIKNPGSVLGSHAKSFRVWKRYTKPERLATVLELGKYYDDAVPGNYYFTTAASSPYGLAENGL